ncbi:MAG: methyltransferase domain-containing protein [Alphaproteobacteria bacterium]
MAGSASDTLAVTHDRLLGGRVLFDQPADGYRASVDAVLLAAAVAALPGQRVLELGSGAGATALCLARRVEGCQVTGLERDPQLAALANANAAANGWADRMLFVTGDVVEQHSKVPEGDFDHAFANPPYLEAERADRRGHGASSDADSARRRAHLAEIEDAVPLAAWLDRLCRAVRPKGRIALIQRADRLADILAGLNGRAGDIAVLPLWPKAGAPARRVIVSARAGSHAPLRLLAGLVLHDADGAYSAAAQAILRDCAPLDL